ncbi:hypothetical protein J1N35_032753 [Gossypium stocksii]|uniref:Uncharacterized protein n=1 Tax=Gossypium stocksii TaxID=47602 RepID=A0A9D3V4K4_9ROSI|nr:hypothetical protein J1N35_032753 [Gossypium stocksii]
MVFFLIELKDILDGLSDPKLKIISEASTWVGTLLVEGKEKTRAAEDLFEPPKLYEGPLCSSLGRCRLLLDSDGMMDGVQGSEDTPEDAEIGKVKPVLLSKVDIQRCSGLLTEIEAKTGLFLTELQGFSEAPAFE